VLHEGKLQSLSTQLQEVDERRPMQQHTQLPTPEQVE